MKQRIIRLKNRLKGLIIDERNKWLFIGNTLKRPQCDECNKRPFSDIYWNPRLDMFMCGACIKKKAQTKRKNIFKSISFTIGIIFSLCGIVSFIINIVNIAT